MTRRSLAIPSTLCHAKKKKQRNNYCNNERGKTQYHSRTLALPPKLLNNAVKKKTTHDDRKNRY